MDLLKAQFAKIQQQLSGLTASQKMLAFALVAIMAMTLAYMARYASTADYEPLLNQSFSTSDVAQITGDLDARSIHYTVSGDRILVPSDQKVVILADLSYKHLLPDRTNAAFDDIVKQMSPFDAADKTAQLWLEAKSDYLQAIIDKFPNVGSANVLIDPTDQRRFDGHDVTPTAAIFVTTYHAADTNPRQIATAAADLVSGAVAGLARSRIKVVIDGATISIPDNSSEDGTLDSDSILDLKRANERMYSDKIKSQFGFIKGEIYVAVSVDLSTDSVDKTETKVDPKGVVHVSQNEKEHTVESTTPGAGGEPGANPNVSTNGAVAVGGGAGGGGATSNENQTETGYQIVVPTTLVHTKQNPGAAQPVGASVRLPRSYFVQEYKASNKDAEPDEAAFNAIFTADAAHFVQDVKNCTTIKDDNAISVNWYPDSPAALGGLNAVAPFGSSPITGLLFSHVREIGVGMLAMVSLAMVMMMVRKSTPVPVPTIDEAAERQKATQRLAPEMPLAGEVSEGDKMMDGMELNEEAVKTQQMIEQVSDMVTENPDAAANLVKRWLNRS